MKAKIVIALVVLGSVALVWQPWNPGKWEILYDGKYYGYTDKYGWVHGGYMTCEDATSNMVYDQDIWKQIAKEKEMNRPSRWKKVECK